MRPSPPKTDEEAMVPPAVPLPLSSGGDKETGAVRNSSQSDGEIDEDDEDDDRDDDNRCAPTCCLPRRASPSRWLRLGAALRALLWSPDTAAEGTLPSSALPPPMRRQLSLLESPSSGPWCTPSTASVMASPPPWPWRGARDCKRRWSVGRSHTW